jgi:WD40 repeat protein
MRDRLDSSLKLWLSRGKQTDDLLEPGLHLAEGEKLLKDFGPSLSREQTDYIYASIAERNRRRQARARIRYAVMAAISVLAIIAGFQWLRAERQRESVAQALKSEAQVSAKLHDQLRQASWTSFNQAERQFQLGEWREGIALLARAIKFDPENPVATEGFFQELIILRGKALPLPIASFDHQDSVNDAVLSPDGTRILTASADNSAKLWDAASGKLMASFDHQGTVNHVAFSPDGTRILTASSDYTAKLWDATSAKLIASFEHQGIVNAAALSPDGARILTASTDHSAKLWDAASGNLIASFEHQNDVNTVAFSPDGARILTASWDKTAKLWDAFSGKLIGSFAHEDGVNRAAFSPDGTRILTAGRDNTAKLWDAASGKLIASFDQQGSVNGARALTTCLDATTRLWDAASGKLIASLADPEMISVWSGVFSPDGARVLTHNQNNTARLWDAASAKLIASFAHLGSIPPEMAFLEGGRPSWRYHFSPDGARVLTTSADHSAKLWSAASGKLLTSFAHQDEVFQAEFSPGGTRVLTASRDKTAKLWDATSGKLIASFDHPHGLNHAAFSPDGARILTASGDHSAKLWDAASGKLIASFDHQDTVRWAGFSPDGTRILTVWDKNATLWDAATPVELARQVKQLGSDSARIGSSVLMANSPTQQVESLSAIASGLEFSDDGSLVAVDEEHRSKLAKQLKDSAQGPAPIARFIRWFFNKGSDQTIFPASDVKISEWVNNALLTNSNVTEEWVRNALIFLPNHPLLHIALAGFETESKRADFLRSFSLARLPKNGAVCRRAGEMLLAQHQPRLALAAVEKALLADPMDQPAQRLRLEILNAVPER